jgi:hypothetical protein
MALRGTFYNSQSRPGLLPRIGGFFLLLAIALVKPATAILPFRAAATFSTGSRRDASAVTAHSGASGLAKVRKEVPLGSEEGTKGVIQYALYVPHQRSLPLPTPTTASKPT